MSMAIDVSPVAGRSDLAAYDRAKYGTLEALNKKWFLDYKMGQ